MIKLNGEELTLEQVIAVSSSLEKVEIDENCIKSMNDSVDTVQGFIDDKKVVYGVTTGFGALANVSIPSEKVKELQKNIILSHAAGVGTPFKKEIVRTMMLLRVNSLVKGFSGIRVESVNKIIDFLNYDIVPVVPSQGSVGASGDLAPLAHIAMALMGYGKVIFKGETTDSIIAMEECGIEKLEPIQKEGLALLNGTQMMAAVLSHTLYGAYKLLEWAIVSSSMTIDALRGSTTPFDFRIHEIRKHPGQKYISEKILAYLEGSEIRESHKKCSKVQDAYSLRAIPQVFGAVKDTLDYVGTVLEREMNSVTDNPIIVDGEALSGGNFHGEPLALVADFLSIALAELGSITERRIDRLVNPLVSSLPPFLAKGAEGINSGYMIWQYTSAALASENKSLAHPASVDSIPTSAFQEDHVSMGSIGARKSYEILENCRKIVAIELMLSYRGLEFLFPQKTGDKLLEVIKGFSGEFEAYECDRFFGDDFNRILKYISINDPY